MKASIYVYYKKKNVLYHLTMKKQSENICISIILIYIRLDFSFFYASYKMGEKFLDRMTQ